MKRKSKKADLEWVSQVTDAVKVSVNCEPLTKNSDPLMGVFAFSYTIRIENQGLEAVQLLERHWIIKSKGLQIGEVVGPGVVGEQPVLEGGEAFQYSSGAVIQDPYGSMEGSYTFRSHGGRFFAVTIPKLDLFYPLVIH